MVTRDVEWDPYERSKLLALAEYEAGVCECGFHQSVADTDPHLEIAARVCPVCAGVTQSTRVLHAEDDKHVKSLGKNAPPQKALPDDGRYLFLRPPAEEITAPEADNT
jgi:hypothetical protein